jgi:excisionase family DNA binding protein
MIQPTKPTPVIYRPADLAKLLKVSRQTIANRLADGTIPARHFGGAVVVLAEDVHRMLLALPPYEARSRAAEKPLQAPTAA